MRNLFLFAAAPALFLMLARPLRAEKRGSSSAPAAKPKAVSPEAAAYAAKKKDWSDRLKAAQTPEARAVVLDEMRRDEPSRPSQRILSEDERRASERAEGERMRAKDQLVRSQAKSKPARVVKEREKKAGKP